jgi:hypothetical protein
MLDNDNIDQLHSSENTVMIQNEILSLESQIANFEIAITSAEQRVQLYELQKTPGVESMIMGTQLEIFSYKSQKDTLEAQKQGLENQLDQLLQN